MSTAIAPTETTTTTEPYSRVWGLYDTEARRRAARLGWQRRKGQYVPATWECWHDAVRQADPHALRLYCADHAEAVTHFYRDRFPDDDLILTALATVRGYAAGTLDDRARLTVNRRVTQRYHALEGMGLDTGTDPAMAVLAAAGMALLKLSCHMTWSLYYSDLATLPDKKEARRFEARHLAAVEALKLR